jgi:hypothetical protein
MKIFLLMMLIGVIVGASRRQPQQIAPAPADSVVANA